MNLEICRAIPADHPSLAGHFPGAPIVPGVVILDEVAAVLAESRRECQLTRICAAKFLLPLKPGQPFTISFTAAKEQDSRINFRCRADSRILVEGCVELSCRAE
ncbi:MAG: 3-hydroxyacyl-[acyl-carrier-protein] dehydratase [Verrucomicrobiota bacterium]|jgi:3-hydroxymyristoyl/3-hydroxydecanoyl-(acyl carrier protein) dehydratase